MNHAHALVTVCPKYVNPTSEDIMLHIIIIVTSEVRSCVKVEVAVLGPPSLTVLMVSVDVKQN